MPAPPMRSTRPLPPLRVNESMPLFIAGDGFFASRSVQFATLAVRERTACKLYLRANWSKPVC